MDRAANLLERLTYYERVAASIDADRRLPKIREVMTDPVWQFWMDSALDTERRNGWFQNVRAHISSGDFDGAERMLRRFETERGMLAQLASQWDKTAPRRNARKREPKSRRAAWAEQLADHLRAQGGTQEERWNAIPKSSRPMELDSLEADYSIYRDGDVLVCRSYDASGKLEFEEELKKSSFFRRYKGKDT